MERVRGIEPLSSAWKAEVIPLYDTRKLCCGGEVDSLLQVAPQL